LVKVGQSCRSNWAKVGQSLRTKLVKFGAKIKIKGAKIWQNYIFGYVCPGKTVKLC
jgi:hypothetical protein